ncbi:MAG: stimulus-sensing domain-containing protein [Alphaproteobacteria bacterium]
MIFSRLWPVVPLRRLRRRRSWPFSLLTLRILVVNLLPLLILLGGILYLGDYQQRLIETELSSLENEARLVAYALAEGSVQEDMEETSILNEKLSKQVIRRLAEASPTRTQLYSAEHKLVADSLHLPRSTGWFIEKNALNAPQNNIEWYEWFFDHLDNLLARLVKRHEFAAFPFAEKDSTALLPDVVSALDGAASSTIWRKNNGVILTAAVPVQQFKRVMGAVLLLRDGSGLMTSIRQVRLEVMKVFGVSLLVTILLSSYLAGTIARPIRKLAAAAKRLRYAPGNIDQVPDFTHRLDEIGDLSEALREMTSALYQRMTAIERFAADVAHELKNPLTSMRSAIETVQRIPDIERQRKLMGIIYDDLQRMDRLISDISSASRLDADLGRSDMLPVNIKSMLEMLADIHNTATEEADENSVPRIIVNAAEGLVVMAAESRLMQVFQNLVGNALSFSPPHGVITLSATKQGDWVMIAVEDQGPGIPESREEKIFNRFYSERPVGEKFGSHSGLGLSISKQIVEAHSGTIKAMNHLSTDGTTQGARFEVLLPLK